MESVYSASSPVICEGETVTDAEVTIGFNFRGIEFLARQRNYTQIIALVERVCGICSNIKDR
jgi:Ni,Fe-hydrogenase III large subunit